MQWHPGMGDNQCISQGSSFNGCSIFAKDQHFLSMQWLYGKELWSILIVV